MTDYALSIDPIEAPCGFASKECLELRARPIFKDFKYTAEDVVSVGREQTGHRVVAAEHATFDAENRDGMEDHAAIAFDRPRTVGQAEF